jgi:hypothetical protein
VKCHSLGRFLPHTGEAAQRLDQLIYQWAKRHGVSLISVSQNGILKPGGKPMPDIMPDIDSF